MPKSRYELTNFSGFWWNGRRWTKKVTGGCCSHRNLGNDGRKAWKAFYNAPYGHFILIRYFRKGGKRYAQEWELVPRKTEDKNDKGNS